MKIYKVRGDSKPDGDGFRRFTDPEKAREYSEQRIKESVEHDTEGWKEYFKVQEEEIE